MDLLNQEPQNNTHEDLKEEITLLQQRVQLLEEENQILKDQSMKDPKTGLLNSRGLEYEVERKVSTTLRDIWEGKEEEKDERIMYVDMNKLREVNNTQGHSEGDILISNMANYLQSVGSRAGDIVARVGGDEFLLLLHNDTREKNIYLELLTESAPNLTFSAGIVDINLVNIYREILKQLNEQEKADKGVVKEKMKEKLKELWEVADATMYIAKKTGSDTANILFYSELTTDEKNTLYEQYYQTRKNSTL
jgi:diguanylate cyclase (GGDEF)-like protein